MMKKYSLLLLLLVFGQVCYGQFVFQGIVIDSRGQNYIPGASIELIGTTTNRGNVSDMNGLFYIACPDKNRKAVEVLVKAPGYKIFDATFNLGDRPVAIQLTKINPDKETPKEVRIVGLVRGRDKDLIVEPRIIIDGTSNVQIGTDGHFIVNHKTLMNAVFVTCTADGYLPFGRWINIGDAPLEIVLEKTSDKDRYSKSDTLQILRDNQLVQNVLGDGCCEPHSENYHAFLWELKKRLTDYFSPSQLGALQSKPLENNLEDIILTLARRTKGLPCEEEYLITMELIDWLHQNDMVKWRFNHYNELYLLARTFLVEDLQSVRTSLSLLLMEGFKKTYLTNNYQPLRLRAGFFSRRKKIIDYKNRVKIFEYIIAASVPETLNSNLYQAQSELIKTGKIRLPVNELMTGWNWSQNFDQERLVVNYFKSRRQALRTSCSNSPFKNKLLTVDSDEFKKLTDEINRYRNKIDRYQALLISYDEPEVFDGYQSYGKGMQDYSTFVAAMSCQLFSRDEGCDESAALRWNK